MYPTWLIKSSKFALVYAHIPGCKLEQARSLDSSVFVGLITLYVTYLCGFHGSLFSDVCWFPSKMFVKRTKEF